MKRIKKVAKVLSFVFLALAVYVYAVNFNTKNMTVKQKVLKALYPAFVGFTKMMGINNGVISSDAKAPKPFYELTIIANNGQPFNLAALRGKKVLIANTASDCGYTHQYKDLQALQDKYATQLVVIGFPANDFKEQEKAADSDIASFCKLNYGVSFPLMQKSVVVAKQGQNPVYQWLSNAAENGWNAKAPEWNFSKYLIDENGNLTHYFGPSISPIGAEINKALNF